MGYKYSKNFPKKLSFHIPLQGVEGDMIIKQQAHLSCKKTYVIFKNSLS